VIHRVEGAKERQSAIGAMRARAALEAAGVEFTNGDQPGVRMRAK
jgi:hypothetical protein